MREQGDGERAGNLVVTDGNPSTIVSDFKVFLDYLQSNTIRLTKTKGYLTKKDLLRIFPKLRGSEGDVPKFASQTSYPILHLFYCLSIELDLIKIKTTSTTKSVLVQNERIAQFANLTMTEQYVTLLEAFWMRLNWDELQGDSRGAVPYLEFLLEDLKDYPANKPISVQRLGDRLERFGHFFYYFKYFGLWSFEMDEDLAIRYEQPNRTFAKSITLTPFFKEIYFALLETWEPYEDERFIQSFGLLSELFGFENEQEEAVDRKKDRSKETLFSLLKPLFLSEALNKILEKEKNEFVKGNYQFKIKPSGSNGKTLELSSSDTLLELHKLIQKAFDLDDDHLYAFYMDGKKFGQDAYHSPMGGPGPYVTEAKIGGLNLYEGQGFLYLYDFGDECEFNVEVMKIKRKQGDGSFSY